MVYLSLLFHIFQLNLKSYMDLLLIWGSIYPQKIILPMKKGRVYIEPTLPKFHWVSWLRWSSSPVHCSESDQNKKGREMVKALALQ